MKNYFSKGDPEMKRRHRTPTLLLICMVLAAVCTVLAYDLTKEQITYEPPNTHMDTQWMWDLKLTINTYLPATMDGNFAFFAQYPEYKFNFEGAYRYWLMKLNYPTKYATLKQYVASGQWCVSGSGAEAGDVNLPSAEGLIRNYLYGEEYFMDEFGKKSLDIYLADCFGFGFVLPTVATHCGILGFSSYKYDAWGGWITTPFPIGKWYGVDSSFVVACLKPGGYMSGIDIRTADGDWLKAHSGTPGVWATYDLIGWGDQGGAPRAVDVSGMITRIRANSSNTIKVYCTSSDQLFRDLTPAMTAQFPSYSGELLMSQHGSGTYTSWAKMKYKNRKNEQRAMLTEFADVTANWLSNGGFAYPQDTIWHAWWRVIACTMHDNITGTSMPTVYSQYSLPMEDSAYNAFTYALNIGNDAMANSAGQQLATTVSEAGRVPLVLVNALARNRCDVVEATVNFGAAAPAGVKVYDPDGIEVPAQMLSTSGQNVTIAFVAKVPSASYSVYEVKPVTAANAANPNLKVSASATGSSLENDFYQVTVNATGDISAILDKKTGKQLLSAPSRFELRSDSGTNYAAWEISYANVLAAPTGYVDQATMTVAENGPARVSLKIVRLKNNSTFTHYVTLAADSAGSRIEIKNTVNWLTTGTLLKASFPLTCANPKATWDLGIGVIQRGNMNFTPGNNFPCTACKGLYEVPGHQWADMTSTDGTYGVSILNDCKYGWNKPSDGVLNLTLIHSPTNAGQYQADLSSVAAVGLHNFTYAIFGHAGSWTNGTVDQGERLNQPIFAFQPATPRAGKIGKVVSLVRTSTPQVAVMAIKKAEKSANYIIRVRETQGAPITGAKLTFPSTSSIIAASEVNGLEEAKGPATFSGSDLTFNLTKYQPKAFSIQLGTPVAVFGKFADLVQPKLREVTLTVALASNRSVRTEMRLPYGAKIRTLSIADALGRIVRNLAEGQIAARARTIVWDGKDMDAQRVRAGVYFVRCITDQGHWTGRMAVAW
jgi:alpha-mannosidase